MSRTSASRHVFGICVPVGLHGADEAAFRAAVILQLAAPVKRGLPVHLEIGGPAPLQRDIALFHWCRRTVSAALRFAVLGPNAARLLARAADAGRTVRISPIPLRARVTVQQPGVRSA